MPEKIIFFDLETDGLLPEVSKIHCAVLSMGMGDSFIFGGPGRRDVEESLPCMSPYACDVLVAHNGIGFDLPVIRKLAGSVPLAPVRDTLVMSRLAYPTLKELDWSLGDRCKVPIKLRGSHSLKAWGYRLGILKGDYGEQENCWAEWSQEMEDYCVQDVKVLQALYWHLVKKGVSQDALDLELRLQDEVCAMEQHGFLFDTAGAQQLYARLTVRRDELLQELQDTFPPKIVPEVILGPYKKHEQAVADSGLDWTIPEQRLELERQGLKFRRQKAKQVPFNPNSELQVAERFLALGWKPTRYTDTGRVAVDEPATQELAEQFEEAKPLAEYVMIATRLGSICDGKNSWLNSVQADGRIHGYCNTMGTVTYRFTHSKPNMGQVTKHPKPYGKECRGLFTVPKGFKLVGCDVSGLELRILGHYLAPLDGGAFAREVAEGDIHTRNQENAGLPTRDDAKTFIYAFLYGAGDGKLGAIAGGGTKRGKLLRKRFLNRTPALQRLLEGVRVKVARSKRLKGLDGREIICRSPHSALNALIQCAGSILVKRATVIFCDELRSMGLQRGRDWSLVAHVHDEWQTECKEEHAEKVAEVAVQSIQRAGEYYKLRVAITGESKIGTNWSETH